MHLRSRLCSSRLFGFDASYVNCGETFFSFNNFKGKRVANLQFVKSDTYEILGVEEKILRLALASDESKSPVSQSLDYSSHHLITVLISLLL